MKERKDQATVVSYLITGLLLVAVAVKPPRWLCQIYAILERAIVLLLGLAMTAAGVTMLCRQKSTRSAPIAAEAEVTDLGDADESDEGDSH